jgi:16S rRNA (uracil1498-N3)-methyltransferase
MSQRGGEADETPPCASPEDAAERVLRVPLANLGAGHRELDADTARYVTRVHRLVAGASFLAFDPARAEEADVVVQSVGRRTLVEVSTPRASRRVPNRQLTVVQAASKGSKLDHVLRDATELGVTRFVVAIGDRSVRKPDGGNAARWRRIAEEAARQCGRGDMPSIDGPTPLVDALREPGELRWLLEPRGEPPSIEASVGARRAIVVIGPEGGFTPAELDAAKHLGFQRVTLGDFVLRTETACAAAIGALRALGFR